MERQKYPIECPDCGKRICYLIIDEKGEVGFGLENVRVRGDTSEVVMPEWASAWTLAKIESSHKKKAHK